MKNAVEDMPSSSLAGSSDSTFVETEASPHMQHLFVMRHGDRLDDADHKWILSAPRPWDPPLTDTGKLRARRLGRRLRQEGWNITRVVCSPFLRCIQTATEVIISLCALNPSEDDFIGRPVPIDASKVKVSIEYGLCEVMNSFAIGLNIVPPTGPTILDLKEIEALLPSGTVDKTVQKIMTEPPNWQESLEASHKRYVDTYQAVADMFPQENVLCVTHGEGVGVAVSNYVPVNVFQVRYCAISHLQRSIHNFASPPAAGPFELLTESGDASGITFDSRDVVDMFHH